MSYNRNGRQVWGRQGWNVHIVQLQYWVQTMNCMRLTTMSGFQPKYSYTLYIYVGSVVSQQFNVLHNSCRLVQFCWLAAVFWMLRTGQLLLLLLVKLTFCWRCLAARGCHHYGSESTFFLNRRSVVVTNVDIVSFSFWRCYLLQLSVYTRVCTNSFLVWSITDWKLCYITLLAKVWTKA